MTYIYLAVIAFALWGLYITIRINYKKHKPGPMVCPLGADCKAVLGSEFSSFFGIGLELFGAAYYALTVLIYGTLFFLPHLANDWVIFVLTGFTTGAFLFSIYLTFVQAFYVKSWCTWCLCSAFASVMIFVLTVIGIFVSGTNLIPILVTLKHPILIIHLLGFALGVGGATITDILFFRFLKDFKITISEDKILKIMSQAIWFGLFLAIISGIGLYLPNMEALNVSSKFLVKVIAVLIITMNGALLNLFISPKLVSIVFKGKSSSATLHRLRKIAFASGGISFVSWYTAFILGTFKSIPLSFGILFSIYVFLLISAIIGSQIAEYFYCKK